MLEVHLDQDPQYVIKYINKNKSILIIGDATKNFSLNQIKYYDSIKKVRDDYGGGSLVEGFEIAKEFKAEHVFLLNIREKDDYIDFANILKQYDFSYVVPLNLYISDYFHDLNRNGSKIYYIQDYIERVSQFNQSTFIFTDKHAELYEDIDEFLDESKKQCAAITGRIAKGSSGNNFVFIANNIFGCMYANIALASALANTDIGEHPFVESREVVFDIDDFDIGEHPIAYFKNNHLTKMTIENLVNLEKFAPILKSVFVDRIIKYIMRSFDLTKFHGRLYTPHQKILIEKEVVQYLDSLMDWVIRDYTIDLIIFEKENIGVGRVECHITIWPKSTTEKYRLVVK